MENRKTIFAAVIFFGAVWGILEATLGYVLQFLPHLLSGSIMFPIGAVILLYAYRNTQSARAVFMVGIIAASIKSVNFFMPGLMAIKTYNPMIAIILQATMIALLIPMLKKQHLPMQIGGFLAASLVWRGLFLLNITLNNALTGFVFPQLSSAATIMEFWLVLGVLGGLMAVVFYQLARLVETRLTFSWKIKPVPAMALLALAVLLTIIV